MRYVVVLIVLLLGAERGWAESRPTLKELIEGEEATNQLVCLAKMEQAMREMDDYMPLEVFVAGTAYGMKLVQREDFRGWMESAIEVQKQWKSVKQECWRDKP